MRLPASPQSVETAGPVAVLKRNFLGKSGLLDDNSDWSNGAGSDMTLAHVAGTPSFAGRVWWTPTCEVSVPEGPYRNVVEQGLSAAIARVGQASPKARSTSATPSSAGGLS